MSFRCAILEQLATACPLPELRNDPRRQWNPISKTRWTNPKRSTALGQKPCAICRVCRADLTRTKCRLSPTHPQRATEKPIPDNGFCDVYRQCFAGIGFPQAVVSERGERIKMSFSRRRFRGMLAHARPVPERMTEKQKTELPIVLLTESPPVPALIAAAGDRATHRFWSSLRPRFAIEAPARPTPAPSHSSAAGATITASQSNV